MNSRLVVFDITLGATVNSVTDGGSFLYPGQPNDEGGHPDIRRDFTIQARPDDGAPPSGRQ